MKRRLVSAKAASAIIWGFCLAAVLGSPVARAAEPSGGESKSPAPVRDLTGLSLEELVQAEITPINVLGSHTHLRGEWMLGYRYMYMNMAGNLDGTKSVSDAEVLRRYPVTHTKMSMEMHMLELMYAPSDRLTLMAMGQYRWNAMDHMRRNGTQFKTASDGPGDTQVMALYNLCGNVREEGHRLVLNLGLSFPTGSIEAKAPTGRRLEYMMQLGSGTYDFLPGLTYLGQSRDWAWGAQVLGTVRWDENDLGYRTGHRLHSSGWLYYKLRSWTGPSLRLDWSQWGNIAGRDRSLNPATNPAFDANKQNGQRLDLLFGLNFYLPQTVLRGTRVSIEGGFPVYQYLAGPNMATDWLVTAGLSYSFH